jgi:hypothetical protein
MATPGVGPQERTDQKHGRPRSAHQRRENGSGTQERQVQLGRGNQFRSQQDAPRHGVEAPQKNQEWNVVEEEDLEDDEQSHVPELHQPGPRHGEGPGHGDLLEVVMPERRCQ